MEQMEEKRMGDTVLKDTVLNKTNIDEAQTAIQTYITECSQYNTELDNAITALTAQDADFNGDAANGYLTFYNQVKPAFTSQLLEEKGLMPSLQKILNSIYEALNATMDPNLGNANKDAGKPQQNAAIPIPDVE